MLVVRPFEHRIGRNSSLSISQYGLLSASKSVLRRRFIVDTDVGVDDLVAIRSLLLHLNQEQQQDNLLLSAVHGMSKTHMGASYLQLVFPHLAVLESPLIPPQVSE
jgi:hypothetical protein